MQGSWADQPAALIHSENEAENDDADLTSLPAKKSAARGRGKATGTTRKPAKAPKKAPAGRGKKQVIEEEDDEDEEDEDIIMLDDNDDDEEDLFVKPIRKPATKTTARAKSPAKKVAPKARAPAKQSTLNFSQAPTQRSQPARAAPSRARKVQEPVRTTLPWCI